MRSNSKSSSENPLKVELEHLGFEVDTHRWLWKMAAQCHGLMGVANVNHWMLNQWPKGSLYATKSECLGFDSWWGVGSTLLRSPVLEGHSHPVTPGLKENNQ